MRASKESFGQSNEKNHPALNFLQFIFTEGDELMTDTRKVAFVHRKQHAHVLALVRKRMSEAGAWGVANFRYTPYKDLQNGQTYPMFTMTKDGYAFLVGKMSGKLAVIHQIAVIEAFNAMAAYIKNQRAGLQFRYLSKELQFENEKGKVSNAAKEMRKWQNTKPEMQEEMNSLLKEMQPSLLAN